MFKNQEVNKLDISLQVVSDEFGMLCVSKEGGTPWALILS